MHGVHITILKYDFEHGNKYTGCSKNRAELIFVPLLCVLL